MSDLVKPAAAPVAMTTDQLARCVEQPLSQLPLEWRAPVWDFWCFWSHLLPTQLALATRLRQWRDEGITLEEVRDAFRTINQPGHAHKCRYAGDLLAELALQLSPENNPGAYARRAANSPFYQMVARKEEEMAKRRRPVIFYSRTAVSG